MNTQQRQTLDRFSRALVFLETNPPVLANASSGFARQVQALKTAVASIDQVASDRGSGMPAKAVVRDVAPYEAQFVDMGLSADFLSRVSATVRALDAAGQAHVAARRAAAGARGRLVQSLRDGRDALTLLDSAIRELCHAAPELGAGALATWNTIVVPRGRANRRASDGVSGTAGDVMGTGSGSGGGVASQAVLTLVPAASVGSPQSPAQERLPDQGCDISGIAACR